MAPYYGSPRGTCAVRVGQDIREALVGPDVKDDDDGPSIPLLVQGAFIGACVFGLGPLGLPISGLALKLMKKYS